MRALVFILLATCSCAQVWDTTELVVEELIDEEIKEYTGIDVDLSSEKK